MNTRSESMANELVRRVLARVEPSVLMTDAYKMSMAQAGFPGRRETFYLSFRGPGSYYIPFDLEAVVRALLPRSVTEREEDFLVHHGYGLTAEMRGAIGRDLEIIAAPAGAWIRGGEPIVTVSGPSFLVSWLEPLAIWMHFPVQVATAAMAGRTDFPVTCPAEGEIVAMTCDAIGRVVRVQDRQDDYVRTVRRRAQGVLAAVAGDRERVFEVGMRAASCMEQHLLALAACRDVGIRRTSNVLGAHELDMTPVGTAGHEHQKRWGGDLRAYRALRDRRGGTPSFLLDTFDVYQHGLPAAAAVMRESPERGCSVRFDSGNQEHQLERAVELFGSSRPAFVFEDGYDAERTRRMEAFAQRLGVERERRLYGFGGHLVIGPDWNDLTRNRVSAVWKLSQTGATSVMKFSESGKQSVPGVPVAFRRVAAEAGGPVGLIGQLDEVPPPGYARLEDAPRARPEPGVSLPSPATQRLIEAAVRTKQLMKKEV